jgi:predicted lipoprotein
MTDEEADVLEMRNGLRRRADQHRIADAVDLLRERLASAADLMTDVADLLEKDGHKEHCAVLRGNARRARVAIQVAIEYGLPHRIR